MVRWDVSVLVHALNNQVLVDGEGKRLANVDIVERLHQVIHSEVVDRQLRHKLVLIVRQRPGCVQVGGRNKCSVVCLARLVRFEICIRHFVERVDQLRQLGVGSIVGGVRHQDDIRAVVPRLDLKRTIAAADIQVIGPSITVLINQTLLNNEGSRVGQRILEVTSFLVGDDNDGVGIWCQQTIPNDSRDFACVQLIGVFDQGQVDRADHGFGCGQQSAVNTVDDIC